ncbi:MAG: nuclear transport factor 2 family protein [Pseudonocardia sp.]|nr:nuclear transport factor 2 family protein [Pseudonocardia sp.]
MTTTDPVSAPTTSDVAVVRAAYGAFNRQDVPAVLTALDPEIVWQAPAELPFGGTFHGVEEVLGYFGSLAERFEALEVAVDRVLDAGPSHVVVEGRDRFGTAGETVEIAFAHVATMRAGRIATFREYLDTGALLIHLDRLAGRCAP